MKKHIIWIFNLFILPIAHVYSQPVAAAKHQLLSAHQIEIIVDTVCDKIKQEYVYADKGKKISDYLQTNLKAGIYNTFTNRNDLATKLTRDMRSVCYDGHLVVRVDADAPSGPVPNTPLQPDPPPGLHEEENFNLKKVEILPGNIGYFRLDGFTSNREVWPVLENALHFLERSKALIIDVRYNGGGSGGMVNLIECFLFDKKTEMNGFIDRFGKDTTHNYADPAAVKDFTLNMPIYILTSSKTFSAAEDFAYGMQSVHRAQTVGETSGGGAHPTQNYPLGYGLIVRIPFMRSYNPYTHKDWEGVGVVPDIRCPAELALDVALSKIYQQAVTGSKKAEEKVKYQWLQNRITAKKAIIPNQLLQKYTGTYGQKFKLYVKEGRLYCKDLLKNFTFELHPVNTETFYSGPEDDLKIKMIRSATGKYSVLNVSRPGEDEITMDRHN